MNNVTINNLQSVNISTAPIYGISRHRIMRDGNGITTLIAFSGCPLECKYCINPHSNSVVSANLYLTPEELYNKVKIDNLYYLATGGGITFGGGEPLLYADFISQFAIICNDRWKLNIETSLNAPLASLKKLVSHIDQWIVDVKDINPDIYQDYTGKSNNNVIENLKYLASANACSRVLLRIPNIPNFNTDSDVSNTKEVLETWGFKMFDEFDYTQDIVSERMSEESEKGNIGKITCEVLKRIRIKISDKTGIDFIPNECTHKTCSTGICPVCEQELIDIQQKIIDKYR